MIALALVDRHKDLKYRRILDQTFRISGASSMSWMMAFLGSVGSTAPLATPVTN